MSWISNRGRQLPSYLVQQGKYILDITPDNQLPLFTNLRDADNDAVGAVLISPAGQLLNVGIKPNIAICPKWTSH